MEKPSSAALPVFAAARGLRESNRPDARDLDGDFHALYERHFDFVWRSIAGLLAGSGIAVEDVAQDVWLTVARRLSEFRGESSHRTWLFAIARNVARNHRRHARRKSGLEAFDESEPPPSMPPHDQTQALAVWQDVQLFMATLDALAREVFLCRFLLEMTPREVAAATGIGVLQVYTETRSLKRAFKRWQRLQQDGLA